MAVPFSGRCQCGQLSYKCSVAPLFTVNCSCLDCQKTSGAAYVSTLRVPSSALEISGQVRRTERLGESGQTVENGFCEACGSRMFSFARSMPDSVGLFATSLDDQGWYRPMFSIYASRAPHWHVPDPAVPAFDTVPKPEDVAKLIRR